jgi:DNA polymerase III sliding clamp (beta) subunit (PCNA family)
LLQSILDKISLAVKSDIGLITSSALFEVTEDQLIVRGSDRHVMSKLAIPEDGDDLTLEGEGYFTSEVSRLTQWTDNVFGDTVEMSYEDGEEDVEMVCGKADAHFRTLGRASFPSFDKQLEDAESTFTSPARNLIQSMTFVKPFVGESSGSGDPADQFNVAKFQGNSVLGTNTMVLAVYESEHLDSDMRIGKQEMSKVTSFLKKFQGDEQIEVLESSDIYFFKTENGSVFGFTKPISEFPQTSQMPTALVEDEVWTFNRNEMKHSIKALTATADPDDEVLNITVSGTGDDCSMSLSMKDALEKHDSTIEISCNRDSERSDDRDFKINHEFLLESLNLYSGSEVKSAFTDKYFKLYGKDDEGDVQVCLITLRVREL